jgi:hypothetical protein
MTKYGGLVLGNDRGGISKVPESETVDFSIAIFIER